MPIGYTPIYRITKDDLDITDRFNDRMLSIQVTMVSGGGDADRIQIALDNRDYKLATPDVGALIKLELGYKEIGYADEGTFEINDYEYKGGPHSLIITGTSIGFMGALKAPAFAAHDGQPLGDIIGDIASKGGATAKVAPELRNIKIPFFNQSMSPLHMLHELERRFGAIAKFEDGYLIFKPRGDGDTFSGNLMALLVLEPWMFAADDGYSVRFSERTAYARTKVPWLNKKTGKTEWVTTDNPSRKDRDGEAKDTYRYEQLMNSEEEAQRMSASVMDMLRRQRCEANFKLAKGDPWVRDQMPILVRNMFDPVNGSYVAETVTHTYVKGSGIQTQILARPPNTPDQSFKLEDADSFLNLDQLDPRNKGLDISADGVTARV